MSDSEKSAASVTPTDTGQASRETVHTPEADSTEGAVDKITSNSPTTVDSKSDSPPVSDSEGKTESSDTRSVEVSRGIPQTGDTSDSADSHLPVVAGQKRPARSQLSDEDTKEKKSAFVFRPSSLQPSQRSSSYLNSSLLFKDSVSSSGFVKSSGSNDNLFNLNKDLTVGHPSLALGTTTAPATKILDTCSVAEPSTTASTTATSDESDRKNIFLQFLPKSSSSSQSSGKFIFGSNLESKVNSDSTFVPAKTKDGDDKATDDTSDSSSSQVFGSSLPSKLPEVEPVTGEEAERNILEISAKLYVYDPTNHSWKEKGRGDLHLNDPMKHSETESSRLVMRCLGTYKVLLNTQVWGQMICELADRRSVRISAQDSDHQVKVFLIVSNPKHTLSLYNALSRRIAESSRQHPSENNSGEPTDT